MIKNGTGYLKGCLIKAGNAKALHQVKSGKSGPSATPDLPNSGM